MTLAIILLAILIPDIYIWMNYVKGGSKLRNLAFFLPAFITIAGLFLMRIETLHDFGVRCFFLLTLLFAFPKCAYTGISILPRFFPSSSARAKKIANVIGLIASFAVLSVSLIGITWGWKRTIVTENQVSFASLPEDFDGFRIVQLSDWHLGTYRSTKTVQDVVEKVNALDADLILFTGDLINSQPSEIEPFRNILSQLHAKHGVISIMGNHDYCAHHSYKDIADSVKAVANLQAIERSFGWNLLLNEHTIICEGRDSIAILGSENYSEPPLLNEGDLKSASEGLDADTFKILLTHDPYHWRQEVLPDYDIDLTLSGHIHAMQVKVFGLSPARMKGKEWGGIYHEGEHVINVSVGLGGNIPFRFGAWPEINLLTLTKTPQSN